MYLDIQQISPKCIYGDQTVLAYVNMRYASTIDFEILPELFKYIPTDVSCECCVTYLNILYLQFFLNIFQNSHNYKFILRLRLDYIQDHL